MLSVAVCGCETWLIENRVLKKVFGSEEEAVGGWRKFHNEEFHNFYYSPNIRVINHLSQDKVQWQVLVNTVMNLWVP